MKGIERLPYLQYKRFKLARRAKIHSGAIHNSFEFRGIRLNFCGAEFTFIEKEKGNEVGQKVKG